MPTALKLSVLDQSPSAEDRTQDHAIRESLALARHCDALGYHRYWVSEHHNSASIVGTAPEVLMAAVAATTQRIRVGSAGVMLPHYATLKVAEQFRVLEAIAPGRIDLGVGRAPGTDRATAMALNPDLGAAEHFPVHVQELDLWLRGEPFPPGHPFREIRAHPTGPTTPQIWILGSSDYGARLAAHLGLPYAYAYFFTEGRGTAEALAIYRDHFRPGARHAQPSATICVWALAADTEAEARHLLKTREHWRVGFEQGRRTPLLSPDAAEAHPYTDAERSIIQRVRERAIVGTGDQVAAKLWELAATFGLDEIVINTWTHDPAARHRSYELIARAVPAR